jgi:hypothetical protein
MGAEQSTSQSAGQPSSNDYVNPRRRFIETLTGKGSQFLEQPCTRALLGKPCHRVWIPGDPGQWSRHKGSLPSPFYCDMSNAKTTELQKSEGICKQRKQWYHHPIMQWMHESPKGALSKPFYDGSPTALHGLPSPDGESPAHGARPVHPGQQFHNSVIASALPIDYMGVLQRTAGGPRLVGHDALSSIIINADKASRHVESVVDDGLSLRPMLEMLNEEQKNIMSKTYAAMKAAWDAFKQNVTTQTGMNLKTATAAFVQKAHSLARVAFGQDRLLKASFRRALRQFNDSVKIYVTDKKNLLGRQPHNALGTEYDSIFHVFRT